MTGHHPATRATRLVIDRGTEGEAFTTLGDFLDANSAADVEPLEPDEIAGLERAVTLGEPYAFGGGAAALFIVERA